MSTNRTYTRTTTEAVALLGELIKLERKRRRMSESELAERANVARATIQKIEAGNPSVNIGLTFEAASVLGVPLFDAMHSRDLENQRDSARSQLSLISPRPKNTGHDFNDDF